MSKKITVAGIGGVGGYLAGMLADTYDEVSFIARGDILPECWRIPMMKFHLLREVNERKVSKRMGLLYWKRNCCGFFDLYLILYERGFFSSAEREFCRY